METRTVETKGFTIIECLECGEDICMIEKKENEE